jgi:hypothetical protein
VVRCLNVQRRTRDHGRTKNQALRTENGTHYADLKEALTAALTIAIVLALTSPVAGHSGPPFPIVTNEKRGPYVISVWTDPDATDDGVAAGQFWVIIEPALKEQSTPPGTHARVSVRALSTAVPAGPRAPESALSAAAAAVRGDVTNQFVTIVLDHEGPFAVHVDVEGPLGRAGVDSHVDATYDLRPPPYMLAWYLGPFVIVGILWTRLLLRRRAARAASGRTAHP